MSTFWATWYKGQVAKVQHGAGGPVNPNTGEPVAGPETLSPEELAANRTDIGEEIVRNALASDAYYLERLPDWSKISVPLLSCANWGGAGIAFAG